jgi:hypothetical protein
VYVRRAHNCLFLFITTIQISQYAKQARNIQNKPVLKMDNAQQERRYLKYCVKAWTLKAIKQKFGELHSNESAVNGMCSPLPSLSPMPTRRGVVPSEHNDLSAIMQHPDVIAYVNAVEKGIEEKLQNCRNTPKTVRRLIAERSPYTIKTPIKGNHRVVAKRLNMSSNKKKDKKKVAWGSTPERAGGRGMSAIEEDTDVSIYAHVCMMHMSVIIYILYIYMHTYSKLCVYTYLLISCRSHKRRLPCCCTILVYGCILMICIHMICLFVDI